MIYKLEDFKSDDINEHIIDLNVENVIKLKIEIDGNNDKAVYGILNPTLK